MELLPLASVGGQSMVYIILYCIQHMLQIWILGLISSVEIMKLLVSLLSLLFSCSLQTGK